MNLKSKKLKELQEREGPEVMEEIKTLQKEVVQLMDQEESGYKEKNDICLSMRI